MGIDYDMNMRTLQDLCCSLSRLMGETAAALSAATAALESHSGCPSRELSPLPIPFAEPMGETAAPAGPAAQPQARPSHVCLSSAGQTPTEAEARQAARDVLSEGPMPITDYYRKLRDTLYSRGLKRLNQRGMRHYAYRTGAKREIRKVMTPQGVRTSLALMVPPEA